MSLKIVSGGQSGADRAALDAALTAGIDCGGWCPKGRRAEDGPIPPRYPLTESSSTGYPPRTRRNVADSDGTLIVSFGPPDRGTALTLRYCQAEYKPTLVIDAGATPVEMATVLLAVFVTRHGIKTLNVAGPRASKQPKVYGYVLRLVGEYLASLAQGDRDSPGGPQRREGKRRRPGRPKDAGSAARDKHR